MKPGIHSEMKQQAAWRRFGAWKRHEPSVWRHCKRETRLNLLVDEQWLLLHDALIEACNDTTEYETKHQHDWFGDNDAEIKHRTDNKHTAFMDWQKMQNLRNCHIQLSKPTPIHGSPVENLWHQESANVTEIQQFCCWPRGCLICSQRLSYICTRPLTLHRSTPNTSKAFSIPGRTLLQNAK